MDVEITCKYCGYCWTQTITVYHSREFKCQKCNDKNLRVKELDKSSKDPFGYNKGSELDDSFLRRKRDY